MLLAAAVDICLHEPRHSQRSLNLRSVDRQAFLETATASVVMVGVPGRSKGCLTCRKRRKGVSAWQLPTKSSSRELWH